MSSMSYPKSITITIQPTPSGKLLAEAMRIMRETGCAMGTAMAKAQEAAR